MISIKTLKMLISMIEASCVYWYSGSVSILNNSSVPYSSNACILEYITFSGLRKRKLANPHTI